MARFRFGCNLALAEQIADLHNAGHEIILVSSGAVAEGMVRMKLEHRPTRSTQSSGMRCYWSNGP